MTCNLFPAFPGFYCGRNGRLNLYWTIKGREGGLPTVSPTPPTQKAMRKLGNFLHASGVRQLFKWSSLIQAWAPSIVLSHLLLRGNIWMSVLFFFCSSSRSLRPIVCLSVCLSVCSQQWGRRRGTWMSPLLATKHCNLGKKTKLNKQKNHPNPYYPTNKQNPRW